METIASKDQKSIETSEGIQDKVWDKAKDQRSMETSEGLQDKSMNEAKAGSNIVKNEILKHL